MKNKAGFREGTLIKIYRILIYVLPVVLFFSYWPVISLGSNESMNFEFSLPLIWLVVFDVVSFIIMARKKVLFRDFGKRWVWLLFPIFLSISVLWSLNFMRGVLIAGILWLIYFAGYAFFKLKSILNEVGVKVIFWRVFFWSALVVCAWCFLQCVLDLVGVPREGSLMCAGCTYKMFGFPHPNGFAIEPQFMGNLLLAPAMIAGWLIMETGNKNKEALAAACPSDTLRAALAKSSCSLGHIAAKASLLLFVITTTIFLTFSRGAIYSFLIAMVAMVVIRAVRQKSWKSFKTFLIIAAAFLFTLNLQGIMTAVSPTDDTYGDGVAKVLNHLSLGVIEVRGDKNDVDEGQNAEENQALVMVEDRGEEQEDTNEVERLEAVFDGYVEESTDTRLRLTDAAVEVWKKDFKTVMFGVGIGGAGQALYVNGLSPAPKEIVQNEYASLLMETGIVGMALFVLTLVLIIRAVCKSPARGVMFPLLLAYGISACFFSGFPNALQIYLLPAILMVVLDDGKSWYRRR